MFLKVERRRHLALNHHDVAAVQERGARRRIAFAQTDEFKHTREVHVRLLAQGVDERKREARKTQTSIQSVGWRVGRNQQTRARLQSKVLGQRHRQQRRAHSEQQVAALVVASMARTASSCWQQRDANSARHASLSMHRCFDAKRTRARTAPSTPSAVPGVAACSSLPSDRSLMCTAVFWTRASNTCSC
jgi:hypothetical protein